VLSLNVLLTKIQQLEVRIAELHRIGMEKDVIIHILEHRAKPKKRGRKPKSDV
jgi:hypothetical protein